MSITPRQLTPKFMRHLKDWQGQGNRSVKIEIDRQFYNGDIEVQVWAWDSDIMTGLFAESADELPNREQLLQLKRKRLEEERERFEKEEF